MSDRLFAATRKGLFRFTRTPSGAWFCISAVIGMNHARNFPMPLAPRCSWQISGRTFVKTSRGGAFTFPVTPWRPLVWMRQRSRKE